MKSYHVYVHTNIVNGKKYVGITSQEPEKRWLGGHGYDTNKRFSRAIKKYGWSMFSHEIVASGLTKKAACDMERMLIEKYDCANKDKGYNVSPGGWVISEESARKIGKTRKERGYTSPTLGKHLSEETKRRISEARTGQRVTIIWTEEKKERYREAKRGEKNPNYGKPMKENVMEALREVNSKRVAQVFSDGSRKEYRSISEAGDKTGICKQNISRACNMARYTAGGFRWEFLKTEA